MSIRIGTAISGASSDEEKGRDRMSQGSLIKELWAFLRVRKKWWLLPILMVLFLVGTLLVFAQGSALAPFIYTIF